MTSDSLLTLKFVNDLIIFSELLKVDIQTRLVQNNMPIQNLLQF
jgi:hypothetical protein